MQNKKYMLSDNSGRIQPQSKAFEEAVIGALLIEKEAINRILPILKSDMFYFRTNELIFQSIIELEREQKPVDMLTVIEKLKQKDLLEEIGGVHAIAELTSKVTSSAHVEYHAKIIQQKYIARRVIETANKIISEAFDESGDIEDVLIAAEKEIASIQDGTTDSSGLVCLNKLLGESIEQMYIRANKAEKGEIFGTTTGLADLNRITNGWQKGDLIVVAARPAMGKTAFALKFAKSAALSGKSVAIFSLEMRGVSLANRILLSEADISPTNFKTGKLTTEDKIEAEKALGRLHSLSIYVDDNSNTTISKIRAKCRMLKRKRLLDEVIIDYLQLAETEDKMGNREQEIAAISRAAKKMAKELDVPVILLSQLSRKVEDRAEKIPMLSDLRESGAIEQDADMVLFLYRPEYYNIIPKDGRGNEIKNYVELIIAKYRDGEMGIVKAIHNGSLTKIFDYDYKKYNMSKSFRPVNYYEPMKQQED